MDDEIIGIASDHGGRTLKHTILKLLENMHYKVKDYGVPYDDPSSVDYPDLASALAVDIAKKNLTRGILVCTTGIGVSIAANKIKGIRATLVWNEFTARMSRAHNDSNVLCLGEGVLGSKVAEDLVRIWLETPFEGNRHQQRVDKIRALEMN